MRFFEPALGICARAASALHASGNARIAWRRVNKRDPELYCAGSSLADFNPESWWQGVRLSS
jgi:hypothetical protein